MTGKKKKEVGKQAVSWVAPGLHEPTRQYVVVIWFTDSTRAHDEGFWRLVHDRPECRIGAILNGWKQETDSFNYRSPEVKEHYKQGCAACGKGWE
jgi:hypothetical protein